MVLDYNFQCIPNFLHGSSVYHLAGIFNVGCDFLVNQTFHNEWFEQLECHFFWQTALIHLQVWSDNNYRTSRVVNTFTKQVLTETTLFTFQHIGQGFERTVVWTGYRSAVTSVVDEGIDRFLKHSLFVANDDVRSAQFDQLFQTVVTVDNSAVQIIQVTGSKASAVELNHWTDIRWDNRNNIHDHPGRLVAAEAECLNDFQTF